VEPYTRSGDDRYDGYAVHMEPLPPHTQGRVPQTAQDYRRQVQPSPSSYQQMHMKMLQDRAASKQSPMVRQDTANDQRINEYMNQQRAEQDRARFMQVTPSVQPRRFNWQRNKY